MNKEQLFQTGLKHQNQPGLAGPERSDGHDIPGAVLLSKENEKGCSGHEPAGEGGRQQATVPHLSAAIVLENDRDRRTLACLIDKFGQEAVLEAARYLIGGRRPYVSNIARILGVGPDQLQRLAVTPLAERREKIREVIKNYHAGRAGGGGGVQR